LGYVPSDTPIAQRISSGILSLPLFPDMTFADVERVVAALEKSLQEI